jgi:site-specific recombinase XerD
MPKFQTNKNFGYGSKMRYAAYNALRDKMKSSNTIQSHTERFKSALTYFKDNGVKDLSQINNEKMRDLAETLSNKVSNGEMSVSYAKNILSSTNQVMRAVREDHAVRVTPSEYVGERSQIRTEPVRTATAGIDRAAARLTEHGQARQAVTVQVMREAGLRVREAAQLDHRRALSEARTHGQINITDGTKGNRGEYVDRWVPVSDRTIQILERGASLQGDRNNIMYQNETFKQFVNTLRDARQEVKNEGISRLHDLRAAYAVARYEAMTGYTAPVNRAAGEPPAPRDRDADARSAISYELGHGRSEVSNSYVGK